MDGEVRCGMSGRSGRGMIVGSRAIVGYHVRLYRTRPSTVAYPAQSYHYSALTFSPHCAMTNSTSDSFHIQKLHLLTPVIYYLH